MTLFDSHCHLDLPVFDSDREDVIWRARAAGVLRFLNPAFNLASSARAAALAGTRNDVWAAVGIHPNSAGELTSEALLQIERLAASERVVAIGEIGLDYHWNTFPRAVALSAFVAQIELARSLRMPIIIHCRDAMDDVLATLVEANGGQSEVPVLLHAFSGDARQARLALERGYTIGVGGPLTYPKSTELREIITGWPVDRILLETDSPYLAPHPFRGKRNEPGHVATIARKLAELRKLEMDDIGEVTTRHALDFFNIHSSPSQLVEMPPGKIDPRIPGSQGQVQ